VNPEIRFGHCLVHREFIVDKTLTKVLKDVSGEVVKCINSSNKGPPIHGCLDFVPGTGF
jgi:hypothetical protein